MRFAALSERVMAERGDLFAHILSPFSHLFDVEVRDMNINPLKMRKTRAQRFGNAPK